MKNTIKRLRDTAKQLLEQADELEAGIDRSKCNFGEYTDKPFNGCKTCSNPKIVICSNPKTVGKQRNSKLCNQANCKHFNNIQKFPNR